VFSLSPKPQRILCLGAHADDIEIGCGATLAYLFDASVSAVCWVVLSGNPQRRFEAQVSYDEYTAAIEEREFIFETMPDGRFPAHYERAKAAFESLKLFEPTVIFTHHRDDAHQDHRIVSEITYQTFRNHVPILEYEVPKLDVDLGQPNLFVPVGTKYRLQKIERLMKHFGSQRSRNWFVPETFEAIMRLRGVNAGTGYAEGFYCRRLVF
jgi:LmbE family N-acetylglucosaminyl deacetylase